VAQPFNNRRVEVAGNASPIADGLTDSIIGMFSASENGILAYRTGLDFSGYPATLVRPVTTCGIR
jgi:hypothetical protein